MSKQLAKDLATIRDCIGRTPDAMHPGTWWHLVRIENKIEISRNAAQRQRLLRQWVRYMAEWIENPHL